MNGMTRRERQVTDLDEIKKILDKSMVLHLGLVDGDEPYVVPMNYGYEFIDDKLVFYLHGARQGRKLDVIRVNPKAFVELECDIVPFEGDVACKYGITYASVMAKGKATIIDEAEEKMHALTVLMKTQTGKDFEFEDKMTAFVSIIRIDVTQYTAKRRPMPKNMSEV